MQKIQINTQCAKYAQHAPFDHPAIHKEASDPGACCRCQMTPSDRSESCPSTVPVYASSNLGTM